MKLLDFSKLSGWPASTSTWKYQQEQLLQLQMLSMLGGNNYILQGCDVLGSIPPTTTGDGWVVIDGEVLPFVGGATQAYVSIVENVTNRSFLDTTINPYYKDRYATFGTSSTQYTWSDFERNNPASGLIKRIRLAEFLLNDLQTALNTTNSNVDNKADKSNVLQLDNTTAYSPTDQYHPATKEYVENYQGFRMVFVGYFTSGSNTITAEKATTLTMTAARQGTGNYRISHGIGNTNYFVTAIGKNTGTVHPNSIVKAGNYFDINLSNDAGEDDGSFYFQIFTY